MWGTVTVSTVHAIGEEAKQTIKCCAVQAPEMLRDTTEYSRGV